MKPNPLTVSSQFGLPMCPLCEKHPLEIVIKTEHFRVPTPNDPNFHINKVVGAEGRCNACGFVAGREVERAVNGMQVSTVLHVCPDEPNPLLLTVFEEHADAFLIHGRTGPRAPKPPFTSPVTHGSVMGSVTIDTTKFDAAVKALSNAVRTQMDEMIRDAMFGKTPVPSPKDPHTVTLEFYQDRVQHDAGLTLDDLWELDRMGLLECSGRQNTITFHPLTPLFDGSLRAIVGEFRLRKQHLDEWRKRGGGFINKNVTS